MRRIWLSLCIIIGLSGLACQGPDGTTATGPAPLPAKAIVPLAKLTPPIERPVNAPDTEKLPQRAAGLVTRAEALIAERDYVRAINLLERAVGFAPSSPRIRRGLGLAYAALGDRAKSIPHLSASAMEAPDNVRVQLHLGQYAAMRRRGDKATIYLRRALLCGDATDDNPDTAESLLRLGSLLERRGYWTAALECYNRLGKLISAHGRSYSGRGALRSLIARPERCMSARGRLLLKLRRPDEAAVLLERAYRRDKSDPRTGQLTVAALLKTGDFERSRGIVMEMLAVPPLRPLAIALAVHWCKAKKDASAPQALLEEHLSRGGADSTFVIAMAEVTAELGLRREAAEMLSKYLTKAPEDKTVILRLARLYGRTGNLHAAAEQLAALLDAEANETSLVYKEVSLLGRKGIKKELIDDLAAAASKKTELKPALLTVTAMLAETIDQREKAISLLRQVVGADPKFYPAYEVMENLYVADGNFKMLDELVRQVSRCAGDTYFRFYFIGKCQLDRGGVSDAIDNLEQARARRGRHVPTLLLLGRAYVRHRQFRNAEQRLLSAFNLAPGNIAVAAELFDLYMKQRRRIEAGRVVARCLSAGSGNVPSRVLQGRFYFLTNQTLKARRILKTLLSEAPDNVAVRLLELSFDLPESLGEKPIPAAQASSALKKIDRILRLDARNVQALELQAAILSNQGRNAESAKVWGRLHRRMPGDIRIISTWIAALIKAGMEEQAAEAVEKISGRKVLDPAMRVLLLESLVRIKRYALAEKLTEQWMGAPTSKEELILLRFQAMKVYEAAGHYGKAQRLLDRWIASGPDRPLLSLLRSEKLRIYGLAKRFDDAVAYAKKWVRNDPTDYMPRNAVIAVLMEAKKYDKAHAVVDGWIASAGDARTLKRLRVAKLLLYAAQKRFDELIRFGQKWIAREGDSDRIFDILLAVLIENEQYDRALKVAADRLTRQEKLPDAAPKRADKIFKTRKTTIEILLLAGRKRKALVRARRLVKEKPDNFKALRLLRMAMASLEKDDEVLKISERMLKLDPDDPGINNDLGYIWADRGINLDKAEAMIRKALAAKPNEIAFQDSFGWLLYKQGRFAEAKTVFDRIISTEKGRHPVMLDHAADTCWRLGLKAEAVRLWNLVVEAAKKEKHPDSETKKILKAAARKIKAGRRKGGRPPVAPVGKGVSVPKGL